MKWVPKSKYVKQKAKELRQNKPRSEVWFLTLLAKERLDIKFKNNIPFQGKIPDFICKKHKLIIEVDGSVHKKEEVIEKDKVKDSIFKGVGYDVIRVEAYCENSFKRCISILKNEYRIGTKRPKNKKIKKSKKINKSKLKNNHKNISRDELINYIKYELGLGTTRVKIARKLQISKTIIDAAIVKYNIN